MKILVTGAAGMIGRKLVERLVADGTLAGQAVSLKAMQGRIQRTMFHLKHFLRVPFNVFGDRVTVRGAGQKRAKNQQIERSLQKFDTFSRHPR